MSTKPSGSGAVTAQSNVKTVTASVDGGGSISVGGNFLVSDRLSVGSGSVSVTGGTILGSGHVSGSNTEALALNWGASLTSGNGLSVNGTYLTSQNVYTSAGVSAQAYQTTGVTINCFLSGAMIRTPEGEMTVEDTQVGDEIIAFSWQAGCEEIRRVTWAGQAHCDVLPHLPDDEAGYPIRILKDAMADGVPSKDMLITAEHCLFFDGNFVPARMLVNGRSIFFDKSITAYDYFHIKTEEHSVIIADGVLTESYRDTGSRHLFTQKGKIISICPSRNLTWDDAAAPLCVSRDIVEPLFRLLEERALIGEVPRRGSPSEHVADADLHLVTDTGASIRPIRERNGRFIFPVPAGVQSVRIMSRASRPSDILGPFVDDRRYFGVAVGEITLFESEKSRLVTTHLTSENLEGWKALGV